MTQYQWIKSKWISQYRIIVLQPIPVYQSNQFYKQSNTYNQNNTITTYHQWCLILLEYDSSIKHSKSSLLKIKTNARLWVLTIQSSFYVFYYAFLRNSFNWQNIKQIDLRFRCPYQSEVCMHEMYNQTNCMYRKKLSTKVYVLYVWMTLICLLVFWPTHRKNPTNILPGFDKPHIHKHDSHPSTLHMNDY